MKKWIEKDGKHVLAVEINCAEKEILELEEYEYDEEYEEFYYFYKSLLDYNDFETSDFFENIETAKKEAEEQVIEYMKNSVYEQKNTLDALEVNCEK
jgi:hypothetical protein